MEYYAAIKGKQWGSFVSIVYCYWVKQGAELCDFAYKRKKWEFIYAFMCYMYKQMLGEYRKNESKFSIQKRVRTGNVDSGDGRKSFHNEFSHMIFKPCDYITMQKLNYIKECMTWTVLNFAISEPSIHKLETE